MSSPRLRIQTNCEFKAILPNPVHQPLPLKKNFVILPPINLKDKQALESSSVKSLVSSHASVESKELSVSDLPEEEINEVDMRNSVDFTNAINETPSLNASVVDYDEMQEEKEILEEKEMLQAKCQVLEAKLSWWRKEVKSCLNHIAKLKIAVFLKNEREFEGKELDETQYEELQSLNHDEGISLPAERPELSNYKREPEIITADSANNSNTILKADLSIVLRDTRKECHFWENEFLQILMENAEIRGFFRGPHMNDGSTSLCEELHGRIEGLDHARTFLEERNENLAMQINEKDRKLVAALEENLLLQNQLKRTDQMLKETIMRAQVEKNQLIESHGALCYSPPMSNSHPYASLARPRRKPMARGYVSGSSPLTTSNSCTLLYQNRTDELAMLFRKKSDYLLTYTEERASRKNLKMREYARVRVREKSFASDSSCGCSPKKRKNPLVGSDRDPGLGSWGNPPESCAGTAEYAITRRLSV